MNLIYIIILLKIYISQFCKSFFVLFERMSASRNQRNVPVEDEDPEYLAACEASIQSFEESKVRVLQNRKKSVSDDYSKLTKEKLIQLLAISEANLAESEERNAGLHASLTVNDEKILGIALQISGMTDEIKSLQAALDISNQKYESLLRLTNEIEEKKKAILTQLQDYQMKYYALMKSLVKEPSTNPILNGSKSSVPASASIPLHKQALVSDPFNPRVNLGAPNAATIARSAPNASGPFSFSPADRIGTQITFPNAFGAGDAFNPRAKFSAPNEVPIAKLNSRDPFAIGVKLKKELLLHNSDGKSNWHNTTEA